MKSLRLVIVLTAVVATALTALRPIRAREVRGNIESGRSLARAWCAECHRVEEGTVGVFAGDFGEIANLSSTTALSLRVFLHSSHKHMPNLNLTRAQADDIIAYILSRKGR